MTKVKMTEADVVKALSQKFVKVEDFAHTMYLAYQSGKNAMFWGPGGHAKSEMAKEFFDAFGIPVFVQALGDGSQEETLLGGIDLAALKNEGKIEYLVENSFMNHEYVIFEELLDCPSSVLLRLKDILTSGYFRNGTQQYKIKTKMIIALTNRSREEVSEDRSVLALMERFPMDLLVVWNSYEAKDYSMMFRKVLGKDFPVLAEAVAESNKTSTISPRTAIHAAQLYQIGGFKALNTISGFNIQVVNKLAANEKKILEELAVSNYLDAILTYANNLIEKHRKLNDIGGLLSVSMSLDYLAGKVKEINVTDKNVSKLKTIQDLISEQGESIAKSALLLAKLDPVVQREIDELIKSKGEYEKAIGSSTN